MDAWKNARNIELNKFKIDQMQDYLRVIEKRQLALNDRLTALEGDGKKKDKKKKK